jgi:transposase
MDGSGFAGRIEVLAEPSGRRAWPLETKLRIVAESYADGASVGEVARRHGLQSNQVTCWRRLYRRGELVPRGSPPLPPLVSEAAGSPGPPPVRGTAPDLPAFVPLVLEEPEASAPSRMPRAVAEAGARSAECTDDRIEVEAGGVVVRLPGDVDSARLAEIVAALRSTAAGRAA